METTPTKHCWNCNTTKPITEFYKKVRNKDGKDDRCGLCARTYNKMNYSWLSIKQKAYRQTPKGLYVELKKSSNKRGWELTLTQEQFLEIRKNPCYYCLRELPKTAPCIDRIDSSKGYTPENSRACCLDCNLMKNDLTETQFFELIAKIYANHIEKK